MTISKRVLGVIACGCTALALTTVESAAQAEIKVGSLVCHGGGGVGYVFASQKSFRCRFEPVGSRRLERYSATISRVGVDVGVTGPTTLVWSVLASTDQLRRGSLNGEYAGASADASIAIGGGANLLVGGSRDSIVLQPLSVQGQSGINLAVGVSNMSLRYRR